jgi:Aromatic-ring-opening dioxygenase LigAB, LigA subunit
MAFRDLEQFLRNLSTDPDLRAAFKKDPESAMKSAGLSDGEKDLVRRQDVDGTKKYLSDQYLAASSVRFDY